MPNARKITRQERRRLARERPTAPGRSLTIEQPPRPEPQRAPAPRRRAMAALIPALVLGGRR